MATPRQSDTGTYRTCSPGNTRSENAIKKSWTGVLSQLCPAIPPFKSVKFSFYLLLIVTVAAPTQGFCSNCHLTDSPQMVWNRTLLTQARPAVLPPLQTLLQIISLADFSEREKLGIFHPGYLTLMEAGKIHPRSYQREWGRSLLTIIDLFLASSSDRDITVPAYAIEAWREILVWFGWGNRVMYFK